jgi:hypothetical protein
MKGKPGARSLALIVRGAAAFLFGMLANTSFQVARTLRCHRTEPSVLGPKAHQTLRQLVQVFNHRGVRLEGHTQPFETQVTIRSPYAPMSAIDET